MIARMICMMLGLAVIGLALIAFAAAWLWQQQWLLGRDLHHQQFSEFGAVIAVLTDGTDHVRGKQQRKQAGQRQSDSTDRLGNHGIAMASGGDVAAFLFQLLALTVDAGSFGMQFAAELFLGCQQILAGCGITLDETP